MTREEFIKSLNDFNEQLKMQKISKLLKELWKAEIKIYSYN